MSIQDNDGRDGEEPIAEEEFTEAEELDLVEDDGALPWLESDYDDESRGTDTGRIVGFGLLGALLIAMILGGVWWFSNRTGEGELVADGSTIEAPEGPMKERPDDAGGKEFAGTGNVAPDVGEGKSREGQLAANTAPKPSIDTVNSASSGKIVKTKPQASSGIGVQVGAYSTRSKAIDGWGTLTRQTDILSGVNYRVEQGQADIGTVYRLQAVAADAATAKRLCDDLKADGVACQVKR